MKSFKKVLCLVLVVVMALGVSTVAFAGNLDKFNDADKAVAPYGEAVDVLVGLKVVNGVTTTELALDQSYTREQAAKVIAYLVLGQKAADALSADSAPFADVEASRWSAGYIAFCVKQGIIAGYDATTFGPADSLTGYQFAKMLLTAVGYGKNNEYVGEGWSINVAKDALGLDIFDGDLSAATNAAISRKQAMLMAFNTLINVPTVSYNANFQTYYTGASFINGVDEVTAYVGTNAGYKYTLGWTVFGLEVDAGNPDGYGRTVRNWTIKNGNTDISGNHAAAPDYTFTGKVSQKALYEALGATVAGYTRTTYVDGIEQTGSDLPALGKTATAAYSATGASTTTEVYVGETTVTVVIVNNYFAQVTDVDEDEETAEFTVYYDDTDGVDELEFDTTDFEEDDYAVVNMYFVEGVGADPDTWVITKAVAPEKISEKVTTTSANYVKVGSTTYNKAITLVKTNAFTAGTKYDLYLDSFGNIIGAKAASESAANLNYLYVKASASEVYSVFSGNASVKIEADFADGTNKIVNLDVKDANKASPDAKFYNPSRVSGTVVGETPVTTDTDVIDEGFYSYTVDGDDFYTLKELDTAVTGTSDEMTITKNSAKIDFGGSDIFNANSSTKLVLVESGTTYTGYTKFPTDLKTTSSDDVNILYIYKTGDILTTIYVFGETESKATQIFGWFGGEVEADDTYTTYKVFVGEGYEEHKVKGTLTGINANDIVIVDKDSKGISKITKIATARVKTAVVDTVDSAYLVASDGNIYYFGDKDNDCYISDATNTDALKKDGKLKVDHEVTVVLDESTYAGGATEFTVLAVYITGTYVAP